LSFTDFLAAIAAPSLRDIANHWNTARGVKRMPGWRDIDPAAIAPHLGIVWAWRYDRESDSFTGRLAGDEITAAFGKDLRGKRMADFFAGWQYEAIFARHKRVVAEPAFAHGSGAVFIHAGRYGLGERIIMPLAADGISGDGIFGATVYSFVPAASESVAEADAPDKRPTETVVFFPLD
jgi:hypothetical protein